MAIYSPHQEPVSNLDAADASADCAAQRRSAQEGNRIESHSLSRSGSASARKQLIAEEAYRRAERRGFAPGDDWQDWFDAERQVDALLDPDL
jgi:hypothetical protein